jgi:hypothetical protein
VLRGHAPAGAWIEVEFAAWDPDAGLAAQGAITVSVYPDRMLTTIRGVRFFLAPHSDVLPGAGSLLALVNGYQSWNACRVATLPPATDLTSHATLGLTREQRGLGLFCEPAEAGESKVKLQHDGTLEAVSEWTPARPVRPDGDAVTMRLAFLPESDGLAALGTAATPHSSVDQERVAALAAPTGWCSWYELGAAVTQADVVANLEFCAAHFDRRFLRYIQIDDGYQRAAGDWETNDKFPEGRACGSLRLPSRSDPRSRPIIPRGCSRGRHPRADRSSSTATTAGVGGSSRSMRRIPMCRSGSTTWRAGWCVIGVTTISRSIF